MKDEVPMARRTPAFVILMVVGFVEKSSEISVVAEKMEVLLKVVARVIQLVTQTIAALRQAWNLGNASSGSSSVWSSDEA